MASRTILSQRDLERLYPGTSIDGFVPTHLVEVYDVRTKKVLATDAVALGPIEGDEGIRYGYVPGQESPHYGVFPSGKWASLERHGKVREQSVRYVPDYIPLTERDGFVYFVERGVGGPIKIGWSQDVNRRVMELQTANAESLRVIEKIPGRMCDETLMHERFSHLRMEAEWFQNSPEIHEFLASVIVELPISDPKE